MSFIADDKKSVRMINFEQIEQHPLFCGITGGTACGKSTLCQNIKKLLEPEKKCVIICQDNYYKKGGLGLGADGLEETDNAKINWDHPNALEWELLSSDLNRLSKGEKVLGPEWDFVLHERKENSKLIPDADVYLIEGIFVLSDPNIRKHLDLQIFVDVDSDTRLSRRIVRDINHRGRNLESVLYQYEHFVKPGFDNFTLPSKRHANIIVPYTTPNPVCEEMIVKWILRDNFLEKSLSKNNYTF